tara:strand:- start:2217 stop:2792 length:576 start_codon:yes stop_codon:yes gene_type:complete
MVGNLSNFMKIDLLRCLLRIENPVSRSHLSKSLELGEGTIRSILDILKGKGFLESNNMGHSLSEKGKSTLKKIKDNIDIEKISKINLFPDKKSIAIHVKSPNKIEKTVILRDEAIKNGAEGALILKYDKKLKFYDMDYKEDFSQIETEFDLKKNDIIIVAYADSYKLAEYGALAAAVILNKPLANTINKLK